MYLFIYDSNKDKIIEYHSDTQIDIEKVNSILLNSKKAKSKKKFHHLSFSNSDYYSFVTNQQKSNNKEDGVWFGPQSKDQSSLAQSAKSKKDMSKRSWSEDFASK